MRIISSSWLAVLCGTLVSACTSTSLDCTQTDLVKCSNQAKCDTNPNRTHDGLMNMCKWTCETDAQCSNRTDGAQLFCTDGLCTYFGNISDTYSCSAHSDCDSKVCDMYNLIEKTSPPPESLNPINRVPPNRCIRQENVVYVGTNGMSDCQTATGAHNSPVCTLAEGLRLASMRRTPIVRVLADPSDVNQTLRLGDSGTETTSLSGLPETLYILGPGLAGEAKAHLPRIDITATSLNADRRIVIDGFVFDQNRGALHCQEDNSCTTQSRVHVTVRGSKISTGPLLDQPENLRIEGCSLTVDSCWFDKNQQHTLLDVRDGSTLILTNNFFTKNTPITGSTNARMMLISSGICSGSGIAYNTFNNDSWINPSIECSGSQKVEILYNIMEQPNAVFECPKAMENKSGCLETRADAEKLNLPDYQLTLGSVCDNAGSSGAANPLSPAWDYFRTLRDPNAKRDIGAQQR